MNSTDLSKHEKKRVCLGEEGSADNESIYLDYQDIFSNSPNSQFATHQYGKQPDPPRTTAFSNIPRPPLHTPAPRAKHIEAIIATSPWDDEARHSPSELPPDKRAALEAALQRVEEKYIEDQASIPKDWPAEKKEARLISLKNGNASRKSQIRKQFGVTLRMRDKDKEAKKIREVLGSKTPMASTGAKRIEYRNPPTVAGYPANAQQQMPPIQTPAGVRMEMVDMTPAAGFSPINAPQQHQQHPQHQQNPQHPQHPQYSQAPPGHPQMQYSGSPQTQGFHHNFPPVPQFMSQPQPSSGHQMRPHEYQEAPEQAYRGSEDHANKRIRRNSNTGISRADEEKSRHLAPANSAPMGMGERTASEGKAQPYVGMGMLVLENPRSGPAGTGGAIMEAGSRPNSAGSSSMRKRVPVGALQKQWEALNGKGPGRKAEGDTRTGTTVLMRSVEGNESAKERAENGALVMVDKGREPVRGGVGNVVDLVSDDSSSERGTVGPSGGGN